MKYFEVKEDDTRSNVGYVDNITHKWGLPGVKCPVCKQTWSTTGIEYPSVNLSPFAWKKSFRSGWPVDLNEFFRLRDQIAKAFPHLDRLEPGTAFGPARGKVRGKIEGFIAGAPWTIFIDQKACFHLETFTLELPPFVRTQIQSSDNEQIIYEVDLPLVGGMVNTFVQGPICVACGRTSASKPTGVVIEAPPPPVNMISFVSRIFRLLSLRLKNL